MLEHLANDAQQR